MRGYEMLEELGERTQGVWHPSPGSLYPALRMLEDQGLVRAVETDGRRQYELTSEGQADQETRAAGPAPWEAMMDAADQAELSLSSTLRQVSMAISQVAEAGTADQKAQAEDLLTGLRRQVYLLLAEATDTATTPQPPAPGASPDVWRRVEEYFDGALIGADDGLSHALAASEAAGLPGINVSPSQGKLLSLLARNIGARRVLEVGTLGGYSAIWLARALPPDGRVVTLELDPRHAEVARENLAQAGLADRVEVQTGPAAGSLQTLAGAGVEPFDLVFIDADKKSNAEYFGWAMRLTRPGSIIVIDNVVRGGRVADAGTEDPNVLGVRRLVDAIAAEPRFDATTVQTVGSKGYDGLIVGTVTGP